MNGLLENSGPCLNICRLFTAYMQKENALALLEKYRTAFDEEVLFRQLMLDFVRQNDDFWQRSHLNGHLTGSAWILNAQRDKTLLIHHRGLDKWFQSGGHIESEDNTLWETAHREAREECGLQQLQAWTYDIFDLDVHIIPAKKDIPQHLHYDVRFAFIVENEAMAADLSEVYGAQWVPINELLQQSEIQQSIRRMVLKSTYKKSRVDSPCENQPGLKM